MPSATAFSICTMDEFPQKKAFRPGGNSLNFALACKRFGWNASVVGAIGDDKQGANIVSLLKDRGLNSSKLHTIKGRTARNKIYLRDGERYSKPEDWEGGVYELYHLNQADWEFVTDHDWIASTWIDPNLPAFLNHPDHHNARISIDFLHSPDPEQIQPVIEKITLAFLSCSSEEIQKYARLSKDTPVIFMMGSEGSAALYQERLFRQEALPVSQTMDTTGCGDAFQGAFCCSWYEQQDIQMALFEGATAGREALSHIGGAF